MPDQRGGARNVGDILLETIKQRFHLGHRRLLKTVEGLTEEHFVWKATPTAHSIAFNVWHLARWADYLQATIPSMAPSLRVKLGPGHEIWAAERLAEKWRLEHRQLGWNETGLRMDDEAAASLKLPAKEEVLDYLHRAFTAAERAVDTVDDSEAQIMYRMPYETNARPVGSFIVSFAIHDDFHRGQIAALRRAQDLPRPVA